MTPLGFRKYCSVKSRICFSLFQALCQWRIKKAGGRRVGSGREKGEISSALLLSPGSRSPLIPLVARSLFRSSSLTESLEQAKFVLKPYLLR